MIKSIATIKNISYRTIRSVRDFVVSKHIFSFKLQKPLEKDVFELSSRDGLPEVLMHCPPIYEGKFESGIKDFRLSSFATEYRAYNFEGYGDKFPSEYVCIDSKGDRRLRPHIYLNFVEVKPEYARLGVYKNAMKKLVQRAKLEEDCQGRIILDARNLSNYVTTQNPCPSLAHWKCGFRFVNEENNKIMERIMKGELPVTDAPEGTMYYASV